MSRFGNELARGLLSLEGQMGNLTFTINGGDTPYLCTPSTLKRGNEIVIAGVAVTILFTLTVRQTVIGKPKTGVDLITYNGITYRVGQVSDVAGGSHWEIDLIDKNA